MPEPILCKICGKRRARRPCPAVGGDICTICCGTEREVSLSCPLACEYLQQAHRHEKPLEPDSHRMSYPDVSITEEFLRENEELLVFCAYAMAQAATRTEGAVDSDIMAALEALIQTQRTLASGLVYESRPENVIAAGVQRSFSASLSEYEKLRVERESLSPVRPSDVLTTMIFLHRFGEHNQNGRPRGRMFLDFLRQMAPERSVEERASSILL